MTARKFEDLIFWQRARELTKMVYFQTSNGKFSKDYGLKDQLRRSAVSVMSNIAEGFGRGSNKEFIQFLFISKGSLAEVQSQLYVSKDQNYISEKEFSDTYCVTEEVEKMMNSFIKKIKTNVKNGLKIN